MKLYLLTALNDKQSYKFLQGISHYCFHLESKVFKNDCGKSVQHWELKLELLVPGEYIFIFNG